MRLYFFAGGDVTPVASLYVPDVAGPSPANCLCMSAHCRIDRARKTDVTENKMDTGLHVHARTPPYFPGWSPEWICFFQLFQECTCVDHRHRFLQARCQHTIAYTHSKKIRRDTDRTEASTHSYFHANLFVSRS